MHIERTRPHDALSEELLVRSIRNFMATLEVRDIAGGIMRVLSSVAARGGMLEEESAQVR